MLDFVWFAGVNCFRLDQIFSAVENPFPFTFYVLVSTFPACMYNVEPIQTLEIFALTGAQF